MVVWRGRRGNPLSVRTVSVSVVVLVVELMMTLRGWVSLAVAGERLDVHWGGSHGCLEERRAVG